MIACFVLPMQVAAQTVPTTNASHAGEVYAVRGSSIVNNQFVPAPGTGTEGAWIYVIDSLGLRHAVNLTPTSSRTLFARPYAESAIDSLRELVGVCPAPSPTNDPATAQEGSFYIRDNKLWVDHSGFAFQINLRLVSLDALNAFGDGTAIDSALQAFPELRTPNCSPRGAGTGPNAPQAPACPNPLAGLITGTYAGNVIAVKGSSIALGVYTPSTIPNIGTIDDTLYVVDRVGQRHPLVLSRTTGPIPAPPNAKEEVYSALEVFGLCPTPAPATAFEGSFFLNGPSAYVVRNGYAYPLLVRSLSADDVNKLPVGAGDIATLAS